MAKKKIKEVSPPMEFNPMLSKFEPVLPTRKKSLGFKQKRNWWAFWVVIIMILCLILEFMYLFISS